jgi:hypothetical protein
VRGSHPLAEHAWRHDEPERESDHGREFDHGSECEHRRQDKGASDNGAINEASPSANPRGDDDATSTRDQNDRQDMKDQQRQIDQIDRNADRDRADNRN